MNLFYPSHDIALSNGVKHFNPPVAALRLQEDLAYLSDIWNQPYLNNEKRIPQPWGWDWDTRKMIHQQYSIKMTELPSDEDLQHIRQLSSRETTLLLADALSKKIPDSIEHYPILLTSEEELFNYIRFQTNRGQRFVLKTPWSSSGRGLICSHNLGRDGVLHPAATELLLRQGVTTIKKMGGIMAEDWIDVKINDFAMLFYCSNHDVHFVGYSLFDNDERAGGTTYREGYLLSNEEIEQRISKGEDKIVAELRQIASTYCIILKELLQPFFGKPWEVGYLGIDMMTYSRKDNDGKEQLKIHPIVEINLRCTMGVVCRLWYDQHQEKGVFRISPMMENGHFKAEFLTTER